MGSLIKAVRQLIRPQGTPSEVIRASLIRRNRILRHADRLVPYVQVALMLAGFVYLVVLPTSLLARGHHVSENALQPSQVNTYWNWADVHIADGHAVSVASWQNYTSQDRANAIRDAFVALGLPAATQQYSYAIGSTGRSLNGTNAYAILQAPKTDGAEALVLSASWYSRSRDSDGERCLNVRGISIVLALANYLKKYSMWSKDIVFLISDGHLEGAQAWVDSYHGFGQSNLISQRLTLTSGAIWAALNVDYPHHSFSHVGLFFEGANAHLPNLDYVNSASHILQNTGIPAILSSDLSLSALRPSRFSEVSSFSFFDAPAVKVYERAARNLFHQLCVGAIGQAGGPEGVYGRYRIDALTLFAVPADGPHGFYSLGSAIESIFRSLNNLLERFHASFFLYIMTSIVSFVTVGSYLAAPVLISAGMSIQGMSLWAHCCRKGSSSTGKQLRISSLVMKNRVKTSEVFGVVAATHVIGGCIFFVLTSVDPRDPVPAVVLYSLLLAIAALPLFFSFLLAPSRSSLPTLATVPWMLKSFSLLSAGMVIAITATLNFGAATFLALLLSFPLSLARPRSSLTGQQIQQHLLFAVNPITLWTILRWRNEGLANTAMRSVLEEWSVGGSWTLPIMCWIVIPLMLQSAIAGCS